MKSLLPVLFSTSVAYGTQINYYTDGGCSSYLASPPNVPMDGSCYQYKVSGTNSVNIANCNYGGCFCEFYSGAQCTGTTGAAESRPGSSNCASNYGTGFQSFRCVNT